MKEIKLFVSCPMKDKLPAEIMATRYRCLAEAQKRTTDKIVLIDSYFEHKEHAPKLQSLGESIILMGGADIVCFAEGWKEARGCRIEHLVASEYEIKIMEENGELDSTDEIKLLEKRKHWKNVVSKLESLRRIDMKYITRDMYMHVCLFSHKPFRNFKTWSPREYSDRMGLDCFDFQDEPNSYLKWEDKPQEIDIVIDNIKKGENIS